VSHRGDLRKVIRQAREQGWRVEKRKEFWIFYPPDGESPPATIAGTPSSSRSWQNFLAGLKRRGYRR
jgi:hypothetical protein